MNVRDELAALLGRRTGLRASGIVDGGSLARLVAERAAERGLSEAAYLRSLEARSFGEPELDELIELATNHQTHFFRHRRQLEAIVAFASALAWTRRRPLRVWCAGCATGEEPYGLAILLEEAGLDARILATDLSAAALAHAEAATYSAWALRHAESKHRASAFVRRGASWSVIPEIRARVELRRHNLASALVPASRSRDGQWDLVLCRNVLIHIAPSHLVEIARRLAQALAPDGALYLSPAETLPEGVLALREGCAAEGRAFASLQALPTPGAGAPRLAASPAPAREEPAAPTAREPKGAVEWLDLGHSFLRLHELDEATAAYERASLDPAHAAEASFFVGLTRLKRGEDDRALEALRKTAFLDPCAFPALILLAGVYERAGRSKRARGELEQALRCLERDLRRWPLRSHPIGIAAATLDPREALALCRLRLGRTQRDATMGGSR